jgi:hypothetical protein
LVQDFVRDAHRVAPNGYGAQLRAPASMRVSVPQAQSTSADWWA